MWCCWGKICGRPMHLVEVVGCAYLSIWYVSDKRGKPGRERKIQLQNLISNQICSKDSVAIFWHFGKRWLRQCHVTAVGKMVTAESTYEGKVERDKKQCFFLWSYLFLDEKVKSQEVEMDPTAPKSLERAVSQRALQMSSSFPCQVCVVGFLCGICVTYFFQAALTSSRIVEFGFIYSNPSMTIPPSLNSMDISK